MRLTVRRNPQGVVRESRCRRTWTSLYGPGIALCLLVVSAALPVHGTDNTAPVTSPDGAAGVDAKSRLREIDTKTRPPLKSTPAVRTFVGMRREIAAADIFIARAVCLLASWCSCGYGRPVVPGLARLHGAGCNSRTVER
ncbi:hypothetical protein NP493_504g02012 [Ridgeia piscesae]|uniref:Uncharacterized protein n=1 Tax=Ridgeia piscesae TaxID=27915 RepID=A0AAD9KXM6_RIDPI|nr:hypothetical protein NP493_504g02012 [Ridgeia piscesae]